MFGLIKISRRKTVFSIAMICLISCVALAGHAATLEAVKRVLVLHSLGRELSRDTAVSSNIPPILLDSATPVYDGRELDRWSISESRLPAGSVAQFREATIWQRYSFHILIAIGLFVLQAGLIFILLLERKQRRVAQAKLDERLRFEELVSRLSAIFVHLPSHHIDDQIVNSLGDVAQFLGFDFSSLSVFTGPAAGRVAFIWQAPGTPAMPSNLTEKDFPWMARQLFAGRDVSFLDPSELSEEARVDRATVEKIQNRSVHCVPLLAGETPMGVLNVGTFGREQGIAPDLLRRLRLLGEIFANALARKRSDEALRASEEQISLAAESANLGVWSWDIAKDSIWATEKCRDLYGVGPEQEICLQTFLDTLHPDDSDRVRLAVQLALRERREFAEEYRVALSNGSVRWIGAFGRGNYNGAGEPIHMLGVSIDLTSRKQMEERLIHEREFLRQVIDVDPNFIFAKDREGRFTLANQAVADAYGTTIENLVGKSDADLNQNIEEVEFFRRLDQEVLATKQERFIPEERITDAKGRIRWLQTVKRPLFTDDGQASQVLGSATDITERKRAEEKFRLAVEASPNAIVMINGQGQIVLVNAQTEKLFGYTGDELIGQPVETLVPERFRAVHPAYREGFFAAPGARAMGAGRELFARRKDGSEFLVEIGLNPIESADGVFVLTAIVDITERKRAESELQRNREELTHVTRVSALGELAASLAHELNQPLTAILSNAQAAQRFLSAQPADLDEVKEILKDIVADNSRAGEIIRRMRALVKKEDLAFVALDLPAIIREVMQLVQGDATLRNVRLSFETKSKSTLARGDKVQLQQVVLNLLLNAFEAMKQTPSQDREVMVRAHINGDGVVEISVRDHGIGFPTDELAKIFDPFYTTKRDGLGMGLAISRSIVEAHGGRLWAKNNTDRGSTFYFTIPATGDEASLGTTLD